MNKLNGYIVRGNWKVCIPIIILSSFLYTIGVSLFLYKAKAFPTGTGAFAQLIVYITKENPKFFSIWLTAFNIPFYIFFWKSLSKKFIAYTTIWVVFQLIWSLTIFSFSIFDKSDPFEIGKPITSAGRVLYALAGSIIVGFAIGIAFLAGGSTAGTDLLVYYLYKKHKKSIGLFEIIVGVSTAFAAVIIQYTFITGVTTIKNVFNLVFGITTFITILYISITGVIMNVIYPRHRKVKISISSKKMKDIVKYLKDSNFPHPYAITKEHSVYSGKDNNILTSVVYYLEAQILLNTLQKIDENVWVSIIFVERTFGNFNDNLWV